MRKLNEWTVSHKNGIIDLILIIAAVFTLFTTLKIITIVIFLVNLLTFRRHPKLSLIFFLIASVLLLTEYFYRPISESDVKNMFRKGFHPERLEESKKNLNKLAFDINLHKLSNGHFPKSLTEMRKSIVRDVSYNLADGNIIYAYYYYELIDSNTIYLAGVGKDGIGKTSDDILPGK